MFLPDEPYPRFFFAGATYAVKESGSAQAHRRAGRPHRQHRRAARAPRTSTSCTSTSRSCPASAGRRCATPAARWSRRSTPIPSRCGRSGPRGRSCAACSTRWTRPSPRRAAARDAAALDVPRRLPGDPAGRRPTSVFRPATTCARRARCACVFSAGVERRKGLGVLLRALRLLERRARRRRRRRLRRRPPGAPLRAPGAAGLAGPGALPRAAVAGAAWRRCCATRRRLLRAVVRPRDGRRRAARGHGLRAPRSSPREIPGYDEVVLNEGDGLLVPPRDVRGARGGAARACSATPSCASAWRRTRCAPCAAVRLGARHRRDRGGVRGGGAPAAAPAAAPPPPAARAVRRLPHPHAPQQGLRDAGRRHPRARPRGGSRRRRHHRPRQRRRRPRGARARRPLRRARHRRGGGQDAARAR